MAKIVIHNQVDPAIGITLEYVKPDDPDRPQGWHGKCTECGRNMHRWDQDRAMASAQRHVDRHTPQADGIDQSSVVR